MRENIHLFGGDKNQITIFGESAGSWSVSAHILSPLSKGLFKRAIMESGAHFHNKDRPIITKNESLIRSKAWAAKLNCTDENEWLDCLRKLDPKLFISDMFTDSTFPIDDTEFLPFTAQTAFKENNYNRGSTIPLK